MAASRAAIRSPCRYGRKSRMAGTLLVPPPALLVPPPPPPFPPPPPPRCARPRAVTTLARCRPGVLRQPDPGGQFGPVGHRYPRMLDRGHAGWNPGGAPGARYVVAAQRGRSSCFAHIDNNL